MEEKSWLWVINTLSISSSNTICCINILPILILKNQLPFKLIYTDTNGRLSTKHYPGISEVLPFFNDFTRPKSQNYSLKAFERSGLSRLITETQLESHLNSSYIAFQAVREIDETFRHYIQYTDSAYSSFPYILKAKAYKLINDLSLEKFLLVYSVNCLNLIEKANECNINHVDFIYLRDKVGKIWLETVSRFEVSRFDIHRPSILHSRLVISSTQLARPLLKPSSSKLLPASKPLVKPQLKPRLRIKTDKLSNTILPDLNKSYDFILKSIQSLQRHERKFLSISSSNKII